MKNIGTYEIYLTGSRQHIKRAIYKDEQGKCFIKFYGEMIEVVYAGFSYKTVELY